MVVDDGTKPWIWVRRVEHEPLDETDPSGESDESSKLEQAKKLLDQYTEKIIAVQRNAGAQKDDSIPVRSNKKKGLRSKKEVREEIMVEAAKEFKRISQESQLTCGKWLFFAAPDNIDAVFARLAHDLVTGALSKTSAFCAKVATTPSTVEPNHRYLICLYLPDLYDKDAVTEVLRTACRSIGVRPNSAKTDLYTMIGLDSKHPSGMKSTIWNPTDLVPEAELKALLDTYWEDVKKKAAETSEPNDAPDASADKPKKKSTKPKRKAEDSDDDNIFDEVDDPAKGNKATKSSEAEGSPTSKAKIAPVSKPKNSPLPNDSATESESDDPPPAKAAPPTKSAPTAAQAEDETQAGDLSSDEEVPKRPKKVRRF
ncbi:hypothetical protein FRC06_003483 [Ceratobasidium sp. 370]|nr:hypothetical protein FRC06_003483 [Ceratobasidium sp. 370]